MAQEFYIDENGNKIPISGTVTSADMLPLTAGSSKMTSEAINEVDGKILNTLVKNITFGNVTAGNQISVDLSTATDGILTSYTQVKMFSVMYVVGSGNYDSGASVFCTDQNKLRLMPSMTQNNVSARLCFLY